jgi:hypothetical protein
MRERDSHSEHEAARDPSRSEIPGRKSASAALSSKAGTVPSGILMRKANGNSADEASATDAVASASASSGMSLPADLRERFEGSLGTDLSDVRLHTGPSSQAAASSIGARAYAVGNDIHFGAGELDTSSHAGQHLLAHEVAHTVQQRGGSAPSHQNKLSVSQPTDSFEVEADRAADAMVRGAPASLGTTSLVLARKGTDKPADTKPAPADPAEAEKEKKEYPSWKDGALEIPIAPKLGGKLSLSLSDKPGASISMQKEAKAKLFEQKYSQGVQIAPGITGSITGSISASLGASASVEATGNWVKQEGQTQESLVLGLAGKGEVAFSATGSLQLSAGVGVANVLALEGGIKGALTAKASGSVGLGGTITKSPDGKETGVVQMTVGVGADLSANASLVADVVVPGDRINVYEKTLGKLAIGNASVMCITQYANGKVTDLPAVTKAEWLPVPPLEERAKRKLSDEEKKQFVTDQTEVGQGASGGRAEDTAKPPDEVDMTDEELFEEGKTLAAQYMNKYYQKAVLVSDNDTAGRAIAVNIDGSMVTGVARYPKKLREQDPYEGRKLKKVTGGMLSSWSASGLYLQIVEKCAKTPSAVARHILAHNISVEVLGLTFEYTEVPKKSRFQATEVCRVDGKGSSPSPPPGILEPEDY